MTNPNDPNQPSGYPPHGGYPGQDTPPPQPGGYPAQGGYPGHDAPQPQPGAYPPQSGYPGQDAAQPGYPGQPAPQTGYPGQHPSPHAQPQQGGYPPHAGYTPPPGGHPAQPGYAPQPGNYPGQGGYPGFGQPAPGWTVEQTQEVHAFIGNNAERYLRTFHKLEASRSTIGWNWSAFLGSIFWLAYRKLYVPAAIGAGAFLVLIVIAGMVRTNFSMMSVFAIGLPLAVAAGIGMLGDGLLKKRADATIADAQYRYPDPNARLAAIAAAGGVSVPAMIGALVGWMVVLGALQMSGLSPFEQRFGRATIYYRY